MDSQWASIVYGKQSAASTDCLMRPDLNIDWIKFAYTQYVTDFDYLCNSVMLFESLHRLDAKADRLLLFPHSFQEDSESREAQLLRKTETEYNVKLRPINLVHMNNHDSRIPHPGLDAKLLSDTTQGTWADSFTKLLAFNQTDYQRVLNLDSDSIMLQNMDELFLLPSASAAMPRAYWKLPRERQLSTVLMLVEPSAEGFKRIEDAIRNASYDTYDMEIMNNLYSDSCFVISHRPYALLTGEFRHTGSNHSLYFGNDNEPWNPRAVLAKAKYLHFSDWPVPKPWHPMITHTIDQEQPNCWKTVGGDLDCTERELWRGIYDDFAERRKQVCDMSVDLSALFLPELRPDHH